MCTENSLDFRLRVIFGPLSFNWIALFFLYFSVIVDPIVAILRPILRALRQILLQILLPIPPPPPPRRGLIDPIVAVARAMQTYSIADRLHLARLRSCSVCVADPRTLAHRHHRRLRRRRRRRPHRRRPLRRVSAR